MKKTIFLILGLMILPFQPVNSAQLYLGNHGSNLNAIMPGASASNYYKCTNSVTFSCQSDAILISYTSKTGGNGTSLSPYILTGCSFVSCACTHTSYLSGGKTCTRCDFNTHATPNLEYHTNTSCEYCSSNMLKGKYNPAPNVYITRCDECPSNGKCDGSENLICNQNYYGTTSCAECPNANADSGKTLSTGKKYKTDCYVTNFVEETGSGKFDPRCFYSN